MRRVYTRLSPTEPLRCIFTLRDGPNDSLLPSASPERLQSSPAPSVFQTPPRPGGVFVSFPTTRARVTPWEPAAARSCPAWLRRAAASDGSLPAVASSSGHVSPADRRFSPAAAASWSTTNRRSSGAAPAAARGSPSCRRATEPESYLVRPESVAAQVRHLRSQPWQLCAAHSEAIRLVV